MARIAHLILAHENAAAVERLATRLAYGDDEVYVHIDKKPATRSLVDHLTTNRSINLIQSRTAIRWGAYSMVAATLRAIAEILDKGPYDFVNLLSASDYPIRKPAEFHRFLAGRPGKSFMEIHFEGSPWWEEAQKKIRKYHLVDYSFPGKYSLQHAINRVMPQREMPAGLSFCGRSQWMTLTAEHARYVVMYATRNPDAMRFFKHTWGPDEFFFQTVLYSSAHRPALVNDGLRYIDWSEGRVSPKTLTTDDFDRFASSGKYFARKFNPSRDSLVLDRIDTELL